MTKMEPTVTRIIHVGHLASYVVKKWRILLLGMLLGICLFSALGVVKVKLEQKAAQMPVEKKTEISVTETEFADVLAVAQYEDLLAEKNVYLENSVIMQIDPWHKWECWDVYHVNYHGDTESGEPSKLVATCVDLFTKQSFWEKISERTENRLEVAYLREIIRCSVLSGESFSVYVVHFDQKQARILGDLVEQCILEEVVGYPQLEQYTIFNQKAEAIESADNNLLESQKMVQGQLVELQDVLANRRERLTDNGKAYLELYREARQDEQYKAGETLSKVTTEKKRSPSLSLASLKADMVKGGIAGAVAVIFILVILYNYNPYLLNQENLQDMLKVRLLNDPKRIPAMADELDVVVAKVGLHMPEVRNGERKVLLTGSILESGKEEMVQDLKAQLEGQGITVVVAPFLREKAAEICKLAQVEQVILVEQLQKSKWENLIWEVSMCEESSKTIVGVLLV